MKKLNLIIVLFAVGIMFFTACSNPSEIDNIKPAKDPRMFTWTVDTLIYKSDSQFLMRSIWGSSPTDIYICGHNSTIEGKLWHYNGSVLEEIKLKEKLSLLGYDLTNVFGFSQNDIWVIGGQGIIDPKWTESSVNCPFVAHYDGVTWKEHRLNFYDYEPNRNFAPMYGICGDRSDNIWVCGANGWIAHFDGSKWTQDTVKVDNSGLEFNLVSVAVYNNQVFLSGQQFNPSAAPNRFYSISGTMKNWHIINAFNDGETAKFGYTALYANFGKLYSLVPDIYEYQNGNWTDRIKLPSDYLAFRMFGMSEDNILIGSFNGLFHWNGNDIKQMNLPNYHNGDWVWGIWSDGQEAFAVGNSYYDQTKSFLWHGK